jgi:hypothetical protein
MNGVRRTSPCTVAVLRCRGLGLLLLAGISLAMGTSSWLKAQSAEDLSATVRGIVTDAASAAPIRSATVRLRSQDGRTNLVMLADAEGRYQFERLAAGQWTLSAAKASYVTRQFGQAEPGGPNVPFSLTRAQRFTANLALQRGGIITGRLLDETGDPMLGASVQMLRLRMVRGRTQVEAAGMVDTTDDRGAFRAYGLEPGEYYVAAARRDVAATATPLVASALTYYPSATSVRDAQRVRVEAGLESESITITAPRSVSGVRISGTVRDSRGTPAASSLHLGDPDMPSGIFVPSAPLLRGYMTASNSLGRFTIDGVPPGQYRIDATSRSGAPFGGERGAMLIDVPAGGLSNVDLTMSPGGTLVATVAASAGSKLPSVLTVGLSAQRDGEGMTAIQMTGTGGTLRMQMPGLFGLTRFSVNGLPAGWAVEALEADGRDVLDSGIDFSGPGTTVTARLVLTDRLASVSGVVSIRGDVSDAGVLLFPDERVQWTYPSPRVRIARLDRDGRYALDGLPPANGYRAVALTALDEEELRNPGFLERLLPRSVGLRLEKGARKVLDLTAIAP